MYESPTLEKYGTFREVTLGGGNDIADLFTTDANDNCEVVIGDPLPIQCSVGS